MSEDLTGMLFGLHNSEEVREKILKPPFGYQGGKFRMLKHILPHLPYTKIYVEPFGGGGAVLLSRKPSKLDVFNDRYSGVTCFYRCIQQKETYLALVERLTYIVHSREEFIWTRDTWRDCEDIVERAARWYYSIEFSFGCQGRNFARGTKSGMSFGTQFGGGIARFPEIHDRFKNVLIENQSYQMLLSDYDSQETVFYLDPPYLDVYDTYEKDLTRPEHVELLEKIHNLKGYVAISGYPNPLYDSYPWDDKIVWEVAEMSNFAFTETNGRIDDTNGKRRQIKECLWIKEFK